MKKTRLREHLDNQYELYGRLAGLAESQKAVLMQGKVEDVIRLQKERQAIIEGIQNIDTEIGKTGLKSTRDKDIEQIIQQTKNAIKNVLNTDKELTLMIKVEQTSLLKRLNSIQAGKFFLKQCHMFRSNDSRVVSITA